MKSKDLYSENIPIAVVGLNHHTAAVHIREKAVFNDKQQTTLILFSLPVTARKFISVAEKH
jgi:glutamyl-tRNA reductase